MVVKGLGFTTIGQAAYDIHRSVAHLCSIACVDEVELLRAYLPLTVETIVEVPDDLEGMSPRMNCPFFFAART